MSRNSAMYIDRFTSLDDVKGRDRSNDLLVLRVIMKNGGRFSVFDANDDSIARTLTMICRSDWVKMKDGVGYPWTVLELTEVGRSALSPSENSSVGGSQKP
jgi:hypothetical protein